jgi:hypothetical protein
MLKRLTRCAQSGYCAKPTIYEKRSRKQATLVAPVLRVLRSYLVGRACPLEYGSAALPGDRLAVASGAQNVNGIDLVDIESLALVLLLLLVAWVLRMCMRMQRLRVDAQDHIDRIHKALHKKVATQAQTQKIRASTTTKSRPQMLT